MNDQQNSSAAELGAATPAERDVITPEEQRRRLTEAAVLASQGKFRCAACRGVFSLRDGICILARKNLLLGVDMECFKHTRMLLTPGRDGRVVDIVIDDEYKTQAASIVGANLSDIRAVEMSRVSEQKVEKTFGEG